MTKLEKAVIQSHDEWIKEMDEDLEKFAESVLTEDQKREQANKIWELAHKE